MKLEHKLFAEEQAAKAAWKKQRDENRKAKWAEQKAAKPPKEKKPRKRKASSAVTSGAVTAAEEASVGQPPSPSAA